MKAAGTVLQQRTTDAKHQQRVCARAFEITSGDGEYSCIIAEGFLSYVQTPTRGGSECASCFQDMVVTLLLICCWQCVLMQKRDPALSKFGQPWCSPVTHCTGFTAHT